MDGSGVVSIALPAKSVTLAVKLILIPTSALKAARSPPEIVRSNVYPLTEVIRDTAAVEPVTIKSSAVTVEALTTSLKVARNTRVSTFVGVDDGVCLLMETRVGLPTASI
ncbi:MAG: hypothetical protein AMXMBFR60_31160 [Chloroflexota bacterium]